MAFSSNPNKATVLIVDDHVEMRAFLRKALASFPLRILEAADGITAMNLIEKEEPSLLVVDYQMPGWDGITVCQQMRERPDLRHIKILLLTGEAGSPFLLQTVNHGVVDAAILKPVDLTELRQLVQRLLNLESGHPVA